MTYFNRLQKLAKNMQKKYEAKYVIGWKRIEKHGKVFLKKYALVCNSMQKGVKD